MGSEFQKVFSPTHKNYVNGEYDGPYINGKRVGKGKFTWRNGETFEGRWKNDKRNGHGEWRDEAGRPIYVGEFKEGKFSGSGTIYYADGSNYAGGLLDDKFHGEGIMTWADGSVYKGNFEAGK